MKKRNWLKTLSCSVFAGLYLIVAVISLICSTEFFRLAHSGIMSWVLAIGFEIGAMSCLLSTLILPKKKLGLVWFMFVILTLFQCMGNMYAAFINLENFGDWIDMFGMNEMEPIAQKRVLAGISGVILPLVALGFIRIMADVLQDGHDIEINETTEDYQETETAQMFGQTEQKPDAKEPEKNLEEKEPKKNPESEKPENVNTEIKDNTIPENNETANGETVETKTVETEPVTEHENAETKTEHSEPKKTENASSSKPKGRYWDPKINAEVTNAEIG